MICTVFEELEELATKANQSDSHDTDEEESYIHVPTNFLAPSSTFSILVNLDVLSVQSTKAIKKCGHLVQTVTYSNMQISVYCQYCNVGDVKSDLSSSKDDVEITIIDSNETSDKEEMAELTIIDAHGKKNIIDRSLSDDASKYRQNCDQRVTLEESDVEETESKGSFEVHNDSKKKSSSVSSFEKESCNEAVNKESGPILLFDTRMEVETKQETMELKEENEPADIDVSLLSPVVELKEEVKEESVDAEERETASEVPSFRVKPLSQLLQTTVNNNENYSRNQVAVDRYHTNSIPVIDLGDDDEPPSSVGSNVSHLRHVDGGEREAHEAVEPLMSSFPSREFQHPRHKVIAPYILPPHSSIGAKPNKVDPPGSLQQQQSSHKDGSNHVAAPLWNPPNIPELARQHSDQGAIISGMADSPGKIQRLSAQNRVAIKNLMQKSRQYQVSGQTPTHKFSPPVRNLQNRSPYLRTNPRQPFPCVPGVGSVNQVHPVNDSPGSLYRNSSSPAHNYSSPILNHSVSSPVNHGVQSRVLSPGGIPTQVNHAVMTPNTSLGYPSPNDINEPRSRNPGASPGQGTSAVSRYHMNQRFYRPSPGQPSQAMGARSPVYDVAPRPSSPHARNSILNAPPTCTGPASNLMVMVQVTGVGPQSTPLYLYDPREPLPPGYQAVPIERGWRPRLLQNTERGTPVILTDPQGRQISTGEELLFIKYGMKRL